ncbi:MAG: hypothetical protein M1826_001069 [Phylliscum demangeonii]|nr:MAG: hypothetical protein M1826_001069 [Phylliscum demangeonii]
MSSSIDFCTLGMFIIDEIHFPPPTPAVRDIMGGAGSYAALGARLFCPPPSSRAVGWLVDAGPDFPAATEETIRSWDTGVVMRRSPDRRTTRAWNGYGEGEKRSFRYLTPHLRLGQDDLTPALLGARSFHLICAPTRCVELVTGIRARRRSVLGLDAPPLVVWEPVPDRCVPEELDRCYGALRHVDVVSPNHHELAAFFGHGQIDEPAHGRVDRAAIEQLCRRWLDHGIGPDGQGAVIVRAGHAGCYLATRDFSGWVPAYHQSHPASGPHLDGAPQSQVVDPTGGGNAFMGGLAMGLVRGGSPPGRHNIKEAVRWASVAASFAIEQVGMPSLKDDPSKHEERWNDDNVFARLETFKNRTANAI